jgi:Bacterial extracellular solute-binding protein
MRNRAAVCVVWICCSWLYPSLLSAQVDLETCTSDLEAACAECDFWGGNDGQKPSNGKVYNCSSPGLEDFSPGGQYEGVSANFLSYVTNYSIPFFPSRAKEFEACTGGRIIFSDANNIFEDPVADLGTITNRGTEVYDGYFMSYSHFPEVSARKLAEPLNDRIRQDNARLKWEDVLPKVKAMGEYRHADGEKALEFLLYDGDFFVPVVRMDLLEKHGLPLPNSWEEVVQYASFFNGTDLNDDGDEDDFGFCHFPRLGEHVSCSYWHYPSVTLILYSLPSQAPVFSIGGGLKLYTERGPRSTRP